MKKLASILILALLSTLGVVYADNPIDPNQLPTHSKKFLRQNFRYAMPIYASHDRDGYDVMMNDNSTIEFDRKGYWTEVKCAEGVPESVIPAPIRVYLTRRFEGVKVIKIEQEKKGYEVELATGMELRFNKKGDFIGVD